MSDRFTRTFHAGWGDMDFNAHMRNTAYLDRSADVRMMYFESRGFPMSEFVRLRLGPVVQRDVLEYFREVHLLETVTIDLALAGLSADAGKFALRNDVYRPDGKLAARVTSAGGWLDLAARKLATPPDGLAAALRALPRTDDFTEL